MFRLVVIASLILASACSTLNEPQRISKSELHTRIGTALLNNNRLPQATGEFLAALELNPKNEVAHNNLALVYLLRNFPKKAEKHLRDALLIQPKYTEARNNLGRVLIENGKYEEAIQSLEIAKKDLVYSKPEKILTNLGLAYFKKGQMGTARELLKQAINLDKSNCPATNLWAKTFYKQELFHEAALSFDQAISVCKKRKYDEPQYLSGVSYLKIGKKELAKARFEELIQEYPVGKYHGQVSRMLSKSNTGSAKTNQ